MDIINVFPVNCRDPIKVNVNSSTTVENVIIIVCKLLKIGPVARHLFSLRLVSTKVWLSLSFTVIDTKLNKDFEFRIRYNVPDTNRLQNIDVNALNFYFNQVKHGIIHNKIRDIDFEKNESEIIGLSVLDMYRAMVEEGKSKDDVIKDYKKYIPYVIQKRHLFFVKKPVVNKLNEIKLKVDASFIKSSYLDQFKRVAPNYLTEEFNVLVNDTEFLYSVLIKVNPFHPEHPGVSMKYENKDEWVHVCTIDELCYLNVRSDGTVEISRKNGIPLYMKFHSLADMMSYVTLLDGYYRLMVKWTFNLCKDLPTPSLQRLLSLKCHGPVSGEFAYQKLSEKRNNEVGCFILRESDLLYDTYYVDVCTESSSKPVTYKIEMTNDKQYRLNREETTYSSLVQLVNNHRSNSEILLLECLPPSEFDQSNLLLCQIENSSYNTNRCSEKLELPMTMPVCIDTRTLMVFKNMPREGRCPFSTVYRSVWSNDKNTKRNVAIKVLKENYQQVHLKEFLSLTSRWAFVNSNAVVKLYGVTLSNPVSMVMEYLPLGQLDVYLADSDNRPPLKEVDLVEASTYLANALWYLEEAGFIHGNIRCRKLLVSAHTDNSFVVKLADPGLCSRITDSDTHWVPPEFYTDMNKARSSVMADVWAFGTTLWEIFSYGKLPPEAEGHVLKKFYSRRKHLPQPLGCPGAVYHLLLECWNHDPHCRKKPQAAMRDINQILYQVYNARQGHSYSTIVPSHDNQQDNVSNKSKGSDDLSSSLFSELTLNTFLDDVDDQSSIDLSQSNGTLGTDILYQGTGVSQVYRCITDKNEMLAIVTQQDYNNEVNSISSMQSIFELDKEWNLILTGRIGEGFYGEVYRGRLEHMYDEKDQQMVAVKKMKTHAISLANQADFDREISIMLKLEHPNIVRIKGVVQDPELCLVLEYIEHGSLQCYLKIHRERLTSHHLLKFSLDVALGMAYLSEQKLVHRDLAARNILVVNECSVKISDFGLARFIGNNNYYVFKTERDLPLKWYAPESIEFGKFSLQSDVWSYGVTLFEMFSYGQDPRLPIPEQTPESICSALLKKIRLPCPKTCPQYIYVNIIAPCWEYCANLRPTFAQLSSTIEELFKPAADVKY